MTILHHRPACPSPDRTVSANRTTARKRRTASTSQYGMTCPLRRPWALGTDGCRHAHALPSSFPPRPPPICARTPIFWRSHQVIWHVAKRTDLVTDLKIRLSIDVAWSGRIGLHDDPGGCRQRGRRSQGGFARTEILRGLCRMYRGVVLRKRQDGRSSRTTCKTHVPWSRNANESHGHSRIREAGCASL